MHLNTFNLVVIGAGALGCAILENLGKIDLSSIKIVDGDIVSKDNLKNQALYSEDDARFLRYKSDAAKSALESKNSKTNFISEHFYVGELRIDGVIGGADMVIDATDNIRTRLIINDACSRRKIPFLFASLRGNNGLFCIVDWKYACFNCIYRNSKPKDAEDCSRISAHSAATAGKSISDGLIAFLERKTGQNLFTSFSVDPISIFAVRINQDERCETCSAHAYRHRLENGFIQMCGNGIKFSIQRPVDLGKLSQELKGGDFKDGRSALLYKDEEKTVFVSNMGDFLFTGYEKDEAKDFISGLFSSGALDV